MMKVNRWKIGWAMSLLCAAMAIASQAQTFNSLASFDVTNGAVPGYGPLAQGSDGNLYGTTIAGGVITGCGNGAGCGVAFGLTLAGELAAIHDFCSERSCPDGAQPFAGLLLTNDGTFYGVTSSFPDGGTVFRITEGGRLTTLHAFNAAAGATPYAALIEGADGNFYGTTTFGGANNYGTVFRITPSGILTTLHNFSSSDGEYPYGELAQAANGVFYGTTLNGGANGFGTVFTLSPSGAFATLYNFCSLPNCGDGGAPTAGLLLASDGDFYGTTSYGGGSDSGTIFRMMRSGAVTIVHTFNGADGDSPRASLVQGTDGKLYGTTVGGGSGYGTVFRMAPSGTLTTLHSFDGGDGSGH